jgi:hypothetical protein
MSLVYHWLNSYKQAAALCLDTLNKRPMGMCIMVSRNARLMTGPSIARADSRSAPTDRRIPATGPFTCEQNQRQYFSVLSLCAIMRVLCEPVSIA